MGESLENTKKEFFISPIKIFRMLFPIPIHNPKKVSLLFLLFFLVSFVYNILQPLKKTIIMYCPGAGAEALPYLKPFAIAPGSLLLTWFFLNLSKKHHRDKVFKIVVVSFMAYFSLYTFLLNPYKESFVLNSLADGLLTVLPQNFHAAPSILRYWMHTVFYAFSELWGTTVLSLLMWGLVNEISTHNEAKATYALFTVGANSSGIFAGKLSRYLTQLPYNPDFGYGSTQWDQAFLRIMLVVLFITASIMLVYNYFAKCGYTISAYQEVSPEQNVDETNSKNQEKNSILDCFAQVLKSKNLLYITILVVGYNLVYNLSDVAFNKQVEITFGADNKVASNAFMSSVQMYTGLISTFLALVVSNFSMRYFGWTVTALITPVAYLASGSFFYLSHIHAGFSDGLSCLYPIDPTFMTLYLGGAHFCLTRGSKYSVFDSTKEMAYIGLTKEERINGKAAIDGIASRFGKSGGSFVMFILIGLLGNDVSLTIPYVFGIVTFISILWMVAIRNLGRRYINVHYNSNPAPSIEHPKIA